MIHFRRPKTEKAAEDEKGKDVVVEEMSEEEYNARRKKIFDYELYTPLGSTACLDHSLLELSALHTVSARSLSEQALTMMELLCDVV